MDTPSLQEALTNIVMVRRAARAHGTTYSATVANATAKAMVWQIERDMWSHTEKLTALEVTAGLADYAKGQYQDQTYDIAQRIEASRSACGAVIAQCLALLPRSNGNPVALHQGDDAGKIRDATLAPGEMTALKGALDALAAVA